LYRIFLDFSIQILSSGSNWFITKSNWALSAFGNPVILPLAFIFVDPIPLTWSLGWKYFFNLPPTFVFYYSRRHSVVINGL
jgi:hypothetical protein